MASKGLGTLTKQQHYVWAFYLREWSDAKGRISCFWTQQHKFEQPKTTSIAKSKLFYETFRLSDGDVRYLHWIIDRASSPDLRDTNKGTIEFFQKIFTIEDELSKHNLDPEVRLKLGEDLQFLKKMLGEKYHGAIERDGAVFLTRLKKLDATFWVDIENLSCFVYFVCNQLFRTRRMRNILLQAYGSIKLEDHDPSRTAGIEQHIYATNVGAGLVAQRHTYHIVFLVNTQDIPLITGDQPVINLLTHVDKDVKLYYPLSPKLAILITTEYKHAEIRNLTKIEVEHYNHEIFRASDDQLYSSDLTYLKGIVSVGKMPDGFA